MICAPPVSPCPSVLTTFGGVFDVASSEQRLRDIETELSRPGAWDKPEALTPVLQEKRRLEDEVGRLTRLKTCRDDMEEWLVLASENEDQEALESLEQQQKELAALLRTCSNNLNQIARRVNSTGNLYGEDIADLKTRYGELWGAFSSLLSKFEDL